MTFAFDVAAAVNAIAALEDAITTPTPGIANAYTYGNNPVEITDPSDLPAVVHVVRGPLTIGGGGQPGLASFSSHRLSYDIDSIALVMEIIPDEYPGDESAAATFWKSICEVFFDITNHSTLSAAANADDYFCYFGEQPSWQVRQWPTPSLEPMRWYWSLKYTHRFTFENS